MKRKLFTLTIFILMSTVFIGCSAPSKLTMKDQDKIDANSTYVKAIDTNFNMRDAVSMVLKEHPDFPDKPDEVKIVQVRTGGPDPGITVKAELTTEVEEVSKNNYDITLTKKWQININGVQPISYWKYQVTPDKIALIESKDNDAAIHAIK